EIPRFLKTIMFRSTPDIVVQATTVEAVSAVLKYANARGIPVIPRGSGSSPFGGSVPVAGGIVLDVSSMDRILGVDALNQTVTVQAGASWADVDHYLHQFGLCLNTSPSSKFSTVGGWVATGGIGLNSFSKGRLEGLVVSLELVTADGSVRELAKSDRHFKAVFGSEGQLGVVTGVKLAVRKIPEKSKPHMVSFDDAVSALRFAHAVGKSAVLPAHMIYENPLKFGMVNRLLGHDYYDRRHSVIVFLEGEDSEIRFADLLKTAGLKEEKEFLARHMWNERYFPMKVRRFGPGLLGSEVVAPQRILPEALRRAELLCAQLGLEPLFEVHFLADGNALLLCYYMTDQGNTIGYTLDAAKSMLITSSLIDIGARPYSVGVWNTPFSDAEDRERVSRLKAAKSEYDPKGIMNSGKYFSLDGRIGGLAGKAFSPGVMRPLMKIALTFSPMTSAAMRWIHRYASKNLEPKARTPLLRTADECAMCGACVSVCPAYLVVKDERVTARGKLLTAKALARGEEISKEHSDRTFLCMRCKACEQVCQSKLELIKSYDELEAMLEKMHGKDAKEIEKFIRFTEATTEYDELVERGLVIGAPIHGMEGERCV
ncbi:MAG: FAD-binding protein, partial [Methanomassiliicoccales archaeon]|nr:FAD-binding protein [Methanomassiliicoccales archaeon]